MKQILRIKISDQICDKKNQNSQPKNNMELMPVMSPRTSKLQTPVSAFLGFKSQYNQISGFSYHLEQEEPINEEFSFADDDDLSIAIQILNKDPNKRSQRELKLIQQAIKKTSLYQFYKPFLDEEQRFDKLCMRLQYFYFNPYQEIISYGESPRKMYIMMKGSAWVLVPSATKDKDVEIRVKEKINQAQQLGSTDIYCFVKAEDYILYKNPNYKIVNQIEGPTHIGDQALRYRCNRTSSIFSKTTVHLASLDLKDFNEIFMQFDYKMINYYYPHYYVISLFKKNDLFSKFDDTVVESIVRSSDKINICRSQIIYNQGDQNDYLYFIEDGEVELKQKNINITESQQEIQLDPSKLIQQIEMEQKVALLSTKCRRKYRDSFQKAETYRYIAVLSKGEIFGEDFIESKTRKYQAVCKSVQVSLYRIRISVFMKYFEQVGKNQKAMLQTKLQWRAQLQNTTQQIQSQFDLSNKLDKQELEEIKKKSTQFIYFDAYSEDPNSKFSFNKTSDINSYNNPPPIIKHNELSSNLLNDQSCDSGNLSSRKALNYFNKSNFLSQKCLINTSDDSFSKSTGYEESNYFSQNNKSTRSSFKLQNHLNKLSSDKLSKSMRDIKSKARNHFIGNENQSQDEPSIMPQLYDFNTKSQSIDRLKGVGKSNSTADNIFQSLQDNPQYYHQKEIDSVYFVGSELKVPQQYQSSHQMNKTESSQYFQNKNQRDSVSPESQKCLASHRSSSRLQVLDVGEHQDTSQKEKHLKKLSLISSNQSGSKNSNQNKRFSQTKQFSNNKLPRNSIELRQLDINEIQSQRIQKQTEEDGVAQAERNSSHAKTERSESARLRFSISNLVKNRSAISHIPINSLRQLNNLNQLTQRSMSPCLTEEYEEDKIKEKNQKNNIFDLSRKFHFYKFNDTITEDKQKREAIVITNEFYLNQIARKMKKILDEKLVNKKEQHFNPFNLTEDQSIPILKQLKIDEIFPHSQFADQAKKGLKNINKIIKDGHAHLLEESNFVRIKKKLPTMMNEQICKDDVLEIACPKKDQKLENLIQSQLNNQDSRLYIKLLLEKIEKQQNNKDSNQYNFISQSDNVKAKKFQKSQNVKYNNNINIQ